MNPICIKAEKAGKFFRKGGGATERLAEGGLKCSLWELWKIGSGRNYRVKLGRPNGLFS